MVGLCRMVLFFAGTGIDCAMFAQWWMTAIGRQGVLGEVPSVVGHCEMMLVCACFLDCLTV